VKKIIKLSFIGLSSLIFVSTSNATLISDKVTLKGNMQVDFNKLPISIDNFEEIFSEGMFYGRLRTNTFYWDWTGDTTTDHKAMGIGASFIYKTAPLSGFSATIGMYTSQNPSFFREDIDDLGTLKAGKDTLSRYNTTLTSNYGMSVIAQGYLQYDIKKSTIKAGRQMFESVFTASNDTKMIPNTFDGVTATIKDIPKTTLKLAYLASQKLRDHTVSHDVLAFNGWEENDDSAVNKSLTVDKIGNDNKLIIATITNKSIKNLKTNVSYSIVPDVVSNLTLEAHYSINAGTGWKITPGFRYMQQMDNLNSDTAVACLKGATSAHGYTDVNSLDSNLIAYRIDFKHQAFLGRLGYSKIADEADIIAPWRGFPTGGFTRAMAQYNWYANTQTYMLRLGYDFSKANIIPGFSIMARYAIQDFDDNKDNVQADTNVIHIDIRKNIGKNMEIKTRLAFADGDDKTLKSDDTYKTDVSYNEYRLELNYFF